MATEEGEHDASNGARGGSMHVPLRRPGTARRRLDEDVRLRVADVARWGLRADASMADSKTREVQPNAEAYP